jgi:hypothetical protein
MQCYTGRWFQTTKSTSGRWRTTTKALSGCGKLQSLRSAVAVELTSDLVRGLIEASPLEHVWRVVLRAHDVMRSRSGTCSGRRLVRRALKAGRVVRATRKPFLMAVR